MYFYISYIITSAFWYSYNLHTLSHLLPIKEWCYKFDGNKSSWIDASSLLFAAWVKSSAPIMSHRLLRKARSQCGVMPRGRACTAIAYPVTRSIPTSFTPEITGPLGADIKLLRSAERRVFSCFVSLCIFVSKYGTKLFISGSFTVKDFINIKICSHWVPRCSTAAGRTNVSVILNGLYWGWSDGC